MANAEEARKYNQKIQEEYTRKLEGYAEGILESVEAEIPAQEFVNDIKSIAAKIVATLEGYDVKLGEVQPILQRAVEKSKHAPIADSALYAEFFNLITNYAIGMAFGSVELLRLSKVRPVDEALDNNGQGVVK